MKTWTRRTHERRNPLDAHALLSSPAQLPAVDKLLTHAAFQPVLGEHGLSLVTAAVRAQLERLRSRLRGGEALAAELGAPAALAQAVEADLRRQRAPRLRAVFNLTGTVLHTNLGRALLPDEAVQAVVQALTSPANLEYDLATGGAVTATTWSTTCCAS